MSLALGINAARERAKKTEVKHLHLNCYNSRTHLTYVEVKSIGSAGCFGFTQSVVVRTAKKVGAL